MSHATTLRPLLAAACACALSLASAPASADLITNGFTFAVASAGNSFATGTHYHSNTGGAYGNPAGKAEVGRYSSEEVRGLSEYNLAGLTASPSAFFTFNVYKAGGLFSGTNDFPFTGSITIYAYQGNNAENISDYEAASVGTIGSFSTSGLAVGNILSFDFTTIFNNAIGAGWNSLGIRLQAVPLNDRGAWTFDNFRLTSDNLCSPGVNCGGEKVPEPATLALLALALGGTLAAARRR